MIIDNQDAKSPGAFARLEGQFAKRDFIVRSLDSAAINRGVVDTDGSSENS